MYFLNHKLISIDFMSALKMSILQNQFIGNENLVTDRLGKGFGMPLNSSTSHFGILCIGASTADMISRISFPGLCTLSCALILGRVGFGTRNDDGFLLRF